MSKKVRVKGHAADLKRWKCECSAPTPYFVNVNQFKRWHREHKLEVIAQQKGQSK